MLSNVEAALLGAIQGVTEFLPVSSSGHLVMAQHAFGVREPPVFYDVLLHVATLLATLLVLKSKVWELVRAAFRLPRFFGNLFRRRREAIGDDPAAWTVVLIAATSAVTAGVGAAFEEEFLRAFASLRAVAFGLTLTGLLLFFSRPEAASASGRDRKSPARASLRDALLLGLAQGAAILPGLSRSGTTISAGLLLGFERKFAGEYAFLISLPAVAGAALLEARNGFDGQAVLPAGAWIGFGLAFVLGALSLRLLLGWIRQGKLRFFAYYCWLAAGFALLLQFS